MPWIVILGRRHTSHVSKKSFEVLQWNTFATVMQMLETQNVAHSRTNEGTRSYPAEKARQGEIILRKPWVRVVFIAGLVGCVLLVLGIRIAAGL